MNVRWKKSRIFALISSPYKMIDINRVDYLHLYRISHVRRVTCSRFMFAHTPQRKPVQQSDSRAQCGHQGENAPAAEYAQKRLKRDYVPNGEGQTDEARGYCAGSSVITYWIGVIIQRIAWRRGAYTHNRPGVLRRVCARSAAAQRYYVYNSLKWPQRALIHDWRRGEIGLPATRHRRQFQRSNAQPRDTRYMRHLFARHLLSPRGIF